MASSFAMPALALIAAATVYPHTTKIVVGDKPVNTYENTRSPGPDIIELGNDQHQLIKSYDGLFYIDGVAGNRSVRFIVDSGANTTILTQTDAQRVGIDPSRIRYRQTLVTANGSAPLGFTKLESLRVAGVTYKNVRIAIMGNRKGASLLGQDMIRRIGHLSFDNDVMTIG